MGDQEREREGGGGVGEREFKATENRTSNTYNTKTVIIHNKCIKLKFVFWVTRIPHCKGKSVHIKCSKT